MGEWDDKEIESICKDLDLIHTVDPFQSMPIYGKIYYFRLHGIGGYRYKYTEEELIRLKGYLEKGKDAYIMFNNIYMFEDAVIFKKLLAK